MSLLTGDLPEREVGSLPSRRGVQENSRRNSRKSEKILRDLGEVTQQQSGETGSESSKGQKWFRVFYSQGICLKYG